MCSSSNGMSYILVEVWFRNRTYEFINPVLTCVSWLCSLQSSLCDCLFLQIILCALLYLWTSWKWKSGEKCTFLSLLCWLFIIDMTLHTACSNSHLLVTYIIRMLNWSLAPKYLGWLFLLFRIMSNIISVYLLFSFWVTIGFTESQSIMILKIFSILCRKLIPNFKISVWFYSQGWIVIIQVLNLE